MSATARPLLLAIVGSLLALVIGYGTGSALSSSAEPVSSPVLIKPSGSAARVPPCGDPGSSQRAQLTTAQIAEEARTAAQLKHELASVVLERQNAETSLAEVLNEPSRRPLAFPGVLEKGFAPSELREIARRVIDECGLGLALNDVDCEEFPCMVWASADDLTVRRYSLAKCAPWTDNFDMRTGMVGAEVPTDGGVRRVIGFYPIPADAELRSSVLRRAQTRARMRLARLR